MAFENNKLSVNGQLYSNRCYASASEIVQTILADLKKNVKITDFDEKI